MYTTVNPRPDLLHGITLEMILNELVEHFGWPALGGQISIRCFTSNPSVASSLKFLRKTPWARAKVEALYLWMLREKAKTGQGNGTGEAAPLSKLRP